jgi:uncharacterized protein YnzC (UPF0291/DUF896 family)
VFLLDRKKILRINELAKKAKNEGLTPEEKKEQEILRREYIEAFKSNLRASLENIVPAKPHLRNSGMDRKN